jgi:hypothetical protein
MTNLGGVVEQLKKEHARLTRQIEGISAALSAFGAAYGKRTGGVKKRKMSAAARKRIAQAQKKRWALWKAKQKKAA